MKKTAKGKLAAVIMVGVLAVLAIAYLGFAVYFQSHFCFGTTIDGVRVGGSSVAGAEGKLRKEIDNYSLRLLGREGVSETINGSDIALVPVFDGGLETLMENQNGYAWPLKLLKPEALELGNAVVYDEDALEEALGKLSITQKQNQRNPVDASCSEYISGVGYEVIPADYGTVVDMQALRAAVEKAIFVLADEMDLEQDGCYVDPKIGDDDAKLRALIDSLNSYLEAVITYDLVETTESVDGETIHTWLSVENGKVVFDEEAITEYVKTLEQKYNTAYRTKEFRATDGTMITLANGIYGWKIDREGEVAQILEDLKGQMPVTREPVYSMTANSHGDTDYGDSYVEINLTAQHLYLYKEGKLIVESDFVSGDVRKGFSTPTGVFPLTYKTLDATLRGEGYATPVKYWMPFNGNVGMHDATWRRSFGGSIFKTNGSHGCINLPYDAAGKIYENIDKGFAVIVYVMPGTESEQQAPETPASGAQYVINLINSIGAVTLDSESALVQARALYDALSEEEKSSVSNYQTLLDAERYLQQLKGIIPWDAEQPPAEQPAEQPPAEQPPAEQPAEQPPAEQPAEQQPPAEQPAEQPPEEQQPPAEQPPAEQPAEQPPAE